MLNKYARAKSLNTFSISLLLLMSNNARDTTAIYTRHVQYFLLNSAVNHKNICSLHKNVHCHEAKPRHQDIHIIHFQAEKVIYNSFDSTGATKQTK